MIGTESNKYFIFKLLNSLIPKISFRVQHNLIIVFSLIFLASCGISNPLGSDINTAVSFDKGKQVYQSRGKSLNNQFLKIFEDGAVAGAKQSAGNYLVSDSVAEYLRQNCKGKDDIVSLLNSNGFKITLMTRSDFKPYLQKMYGDFDEVIFGERSKEALHLYRYTSYKVYIFLEKGAVVKVIANVSSQGL